jgi:hypothetical protein
VLQLLPARVQKGLPSITKALGGDTAMTLSQMRERTKQKWSFDELRMARVVL